LNRLAEALLQWDILQADKVEQAFGGEMLEQVAEQAA
jgi:hypothetical protein